MISASHKIMGDIRVRPITVLGAFLVDELFDYSSISNDDGRSGPKLEGEYSSILLSPFSEPAQLSERAVLRTISPYFKYEPFLGI